MDSNYASVDPVTVVRFRRLGSEGRISTVLLCQGSALLRERLRIENGLPILNLTPDDKAAFRLIFHFLHARFLEVLEQNDIMLLTRAYELAERLEFVDCMNSLMDRIRFTTSQNEAALGTEHMDFMNTIRVRDNSQLRKFCNDRFAWDLCNTRTRIHVSSDGVVRLDGQTDIFIQQGGKRISEILTEILNRRNSQWSDPSVETGCFYHRHLTEELRLFCVINHTPMELPPELMTMQ